jgi:hypothetical protein
MSVINTIGFTTFIALCGQNSSMISAAIQIVIRTNSRYVNTIYTIIIPFSKINVHDKKTQKGGMIVSTIYSLTEKA